MPNNPILEELYAVRRQIMDEHGDNLFAYLHAEFERLKAAGHPIAYFPQRTQHSSYEPFVRSPCLDTETGYPLRSAAAMPLGKKRQKLPGFSAVR